MELKVVLIRLRVLPLFMLSWLVTVVYAADSTSPIPEIENKFRFSATIAYWTPADQITGYMNNVGLGTLHDSVSDNATSSGTAVMGTLEGHYERFGLMIDYLYWDNNGGKINHAFAYRKSIVYASAHSDTQQNIFTGAGTYTLLANQDWYIDGLIGARYITNNTSVNLDGSYPATIVKQFEAGLTNSGVISGYTTTTAPVIGLKGRARIADSEWFVPFYGDVGSAGTTFSNTWQAQLGIARTFGWFEVNLSCRALYFELADGPLHTKNTFFGPSLGLTFNF